MAQKRFGPNSFASDLKEYFVQLKTKPKQAILTLTVSTAIVTLSIIFYPKYWNLAPVSNDALVQYGVTEDGSPWVGAQNPSLTIVEFSDYMCFQCGKMHHHLRELINSYPEKIRLIHRHFPLDQAVNSIVKELTHPNSGLVSLFALKAQQEGLFWQVNDLLFQEARSKKFNLSKIAEISGLDITNFQQMMKDTKLLTKLIEDIQYGISIGVVATPSYIIDGKLYSGAIPESILKAVLTND